MPSAIAAFYDNLTAGSTRRPQHSARSRAPRDHTRRPASEQEKGWRNTGNELHNLPSLFAAAAGKEDEARGAHVSRTPHPPAGRRSPGRSAPIRTAQTRSLVLKWPQDASGALASVELLVCVFQFLPSVSLLPVSQSCWNFALLVRPLVRARVQRRLDRVAELERQSEEEPFSAGDVMQAAETAVRSASKSDIEELRRMPFPCAGVKEITSMLVMCMNPKMRRKPTWQDFQKVAADPSALQQRMVRYDRSLITTSLLDRMGPVALAFPETQKQSKAAGGVCLWLRGLYTYGRCLYKPWGLDRDRQRRECSRYLGTEVSSPGEGVRVVDPEKLAAMLQRAQPLITTDDFGVDAFTTQ